MVLSLRCSVRIPAESNAFRSPLLNTERTVVTHGRCTASLILRRPTGDSGQSGTGMVGSMTTSGCVMKRMSVIGSYGGSVSALHRWTLHGLPHATVPLL